MRNANQTSHPTLARAVLRAVGRDSIEDLARHGADAGFLGITYTRDTVAFWRRHRAEIMDLATEQAHSMGETVLGMVMSFRCLKGYSEDEIADAIYGRDGGDAVDVIRNSMTWFACEEMARQLCPDV